MSQGKPDLAVETSGDKLTIRVDQPIENVEFVAHTLLRGTDGGVLTPSARKIQYEWFRSKQARSCGYEECGTKRELACFQSLLNEKRYCSRDCMLADWKLDTEHRKLNPDLFESMDAEFIWNIKPFVEDTSWEKVGTSKVFLPTNRDVGHVLKVVCKAVLPDGSVSVATESKETNVVIGVTSNNPRLLKRELRVTPEVRRKQTYSAFLKSEGGGAVIRVMSYNVLAEVYATRQLYPYCPLWALSWGYRRQLILKELEKHNADVICLQEMQADHFDTYLKPQLSARGYDGVFKAKTREAMGRKGKVDGCAILYKKNRMRLLDTKPIEYNTIALSLAKAGEFRRAEFSPSENEARTNRILKRLCRDNVGLICVFETIPEGFDESLAAAAKQTGPQRICIATSHIFWDPEFSDVKFWQTHCLLQELAHIVGPEMPLILTGDFNSTPDSAVVQFIANDAVDPNHDDFQQDPFEILPSLSMINHNLQLASAYETVTGSEPACTNYTAHYSGVLDYIWVSTNSLTPMAVLAVPDESVLRGEEDTHIPNAAFPSDHVSLCMDVNINPPERVRSRPSTPNPPSPSLSPPLGMHSSAYELQHLHNMHHHHLTQQQLHFHHKQRMGMNSKAVHSPNPAMIGAYHLQQQQQQQQMEGRNSPSLHPLSHQQMMMQQQSQHMHTPPQYRMY